MVGVERFHNFLNHACKIFSEERECVVECGMRSAYAWNINPIDGIYIIRSIPAIGREFKIPMDINVTKIPTIIDSTSKIIVTYLSHIQNDVQFSRELLQWLLENKRTLQRERKN